MRCSLDSNAWERIFGADDSTAKHVRAVIATGALEAFICETGFRLEAIPKHDRLSYFEQPYLGVQFGLTERGGEPMLCMSFGPDDTRHPGLPLAQGAKLQAALAAGVKLMRGGAWLGLPRPPEIADRRLFVEETEEARASREQLQIEVSEAIAGRGIGKAVFDAIGGWSGEPIHAALRKRFIKACAEWADEELVAAHIAYGNDVLCTDDRGRSAGRSVFDPEHRAWLGEQYGLWFASLDELASMF